MKCEVEVARLGSEAVVLALHGEVDMSNADSVGERVMAELPDGCPRVILELDRAHYLDSSGIRMLYQLSERMAARGASLRLAISTASRLRRLFELTKIDLLMPVHDSVESALAAPKEAASGRS